MGDGIERAVRRLVDKDEIVDLVHRYSYYVDQKFYDEIAELFTEDCVVDYGPGVGPPVQGRTAFRAMFGAGRGFVVTSHHNANVLVSFEGDDRASVRTSCYALARDVARGDTRASGAPTTTSSCVTPRGGVSQGVSCAWRAPRIGTPSGTRSPRPPRSTSDQQRLRLINGVCVATMSPQLQTRLRPFAPLRRPADWTLGSPPSTARGPAAPSWVSWVQLF